MDLSVFDEQTLHVLLQVTRRNKKRPCTKFDQVRYIGFLVGGTLPLQHPPLRFSVFSSTWSLGKGLEDINSPVPRSLHLSTKQEQHFTTVTTDSVSGVHVSIYTSRGVGMNARAPRPDTPPPPPSIDILNALPSHAIAYDYVYIVSWKPEGRCHYLHRCSVENQKGAIAVYKLQWR